MTIVDLLEKNAELYGHEIALVEVNPEQKETRRTTWRDFELVEPSRHRSYYRREISWTVFNEKANRFANALKARGVGRGHKVAILLMNCIEWLPIYFGILKTGAIANLCIEELACREGFVILYFLEDVIREFIITAPRDIGRMFIKNTLGNIYVLFEDCSAVRVKNRPRLQVGNDSD